MIYHGANGGPHLTDDGKFNRLEHQVYLTLLREYPELCGVLLDTPMPFFRAANDLRIFIARETNRIVTEARKNTPDHSTNSS